ncbi:MAG: hypothetical protein KDC38_20395 [Planctomycetes bacterium]|nr:hypothetical protein [Planctomycetota bacterium]
MYDQDIIEKKPSSPLATALLGTACACLIGAMVLQGMMIARYNAGNSSKEVLSSAKTFEKKVTKLGQDIDKLVAGE